MPSKLRIGTEVSSTSSKTAPLLPAEPGKKRRRRQRVYGVVKRSLPNGKWEVEWGDGQIEECAPGILKCMASDPRPQMWPGKCESSTMFI